MAKAHLETRRTPVIDLRNQLTGPDVFLVQPLDSAEKRIRALRLVVEAVGEIVMRHLAMAGALRVANWAPPMQEVCSPDDGLSGPRREYAALKLLRCAPNGAGSTRPLQFRWRGTMPG